jgi:hypothetical protein
MAQMQVLFSKFHNRIVDWLREKGTAEQSIFTEAQRLVVWHYQWITLREFLPELIGDGLTDALLAGGSRYYRPAADPFIPLEFADAAYRHGHGQLRESYRVKPGNPPVPLFPDLIGFRAVPASRVVDWAEFFDLPGRPARPSRAISALLPSPGRRPLLPQWAGIRKPRSGTTS